MLLFGRVIPHLEAALGAFNVLFTHVEGEETDNFQFVFSILVNLGKGEEKRKERKGKERRGKERRGEERRGRGEERRGKERKGKERKEWEKNERQQQQKNNRKKKNVFFQPHPKQKNNFLEQDDFCKEKVSSHYPKEQGGL